MTTAALQFYTRWGRNDSHHRTPPYIRTVRYVFPSSIFYTLHVSTASAPVTNVDIWEVWIYTRTSTYIVNASLRGNTPEGCRDVHIPQQLFCWYLQRPGATFLVPAPSECHLRRKARSRAMRKKQRGKRREIPTVWKNPTNNADVRRRIRRFIRSTFGHDQQSSPGRWLYL